MRTYYVNKPSFNDADFKSLIPITKQIAILDLGGTQVSESIFIKLAGLPNLTVLKLDHTEVTGKNINTLQDLKYLKLINLSYSRFNDTYLDQLKNLQNLKSVYLYDSEVKGIVDLTNQKKDSIDIDYGNYTLAIIASDTIIY